MPRHPLGSRVRIMQLLTVAVLISSMATVGIVYAAVDAGQARNDEPFVSIAAACLLPIQVLVALFVPSFVCSARLPKLAAESPDQDADRLFLLRQSTHILSIALIESAVLFSVVAYALERQPWTLLLAVAGIILIGLRFPIRTSVEDWIDQQERRLQELRANQGY